MTRPADISPAQSLPVSSRRTTRFECKYLLTPSERIRIERELAHFMPLDVHCEGEPERSYVVHSLYFDDHLLTYFRQKQAGLPYRSKYRLRTYGNTRLFSAPYFLEEKGRCKDSVYKVRMRLPYIETSEARSTSPRRVVERLLALVQGTDMQDAFSHAVFSGQIRPALGITFRRRAYANPINSDFRVTFDDDIEAVLTQSLPMPESALRRRLLPGCSILEAKFAAGMPAWFLRFVRRFDLRRRSFSKIYVGVKAFTPARVQDRMRCP